MAAILIVIFFQNLFGLSIQTSLQNLESVAQEISELCSIQYYVPRCVAVLVTKLPIELCASCQLKSSFRPTQGSPTPEQLDFLKLKFLSFGTRQRPLVFASKSNLNSLIRPKNIIFTFWQILVIFQYGGSGVENSKQLRAQKICQMLTKNNNDLYGGSRSTVKSRDIILNFFWRLMNA